ncbi:MAG TPA: hypothetical protein VNN18_09315 [Candidatus Xenobia bacterium]|nr:hypothetical protein [Candidatus Xenobia bacterium]
MRFKEPPGAMTLAAAVVYLLACATQPPPAVPPEVKLQASRNEPESDPPATASETIQACPVYTGVSDDAVMSAEEAGIEEEWRQYIPFEQFDFNGSVDEAFTGATDSADNIYVCGTRRTTESSSEPVGVCTSLTPAGDERWRRTLGSAPSQILAMARVPGEDTFFLTGVWGPLSDPSLQSVLVMKINANGQTLFDPSVNSFQLGGKRSEGRAIAVKGGQVLIAVNTDDLVCDPDKCTPDRVVILDLQANRLTDFPVGNLPSRVGDTSSVSGLAVGLNYLWVTGTTIFNDGRRGYYRQKFDLGGALQHFSVGDRVFSTRVALDESEGTFLAGTFQADLANPATRYFEVQWDCPDGFLRWARVWDGGYVNRNPTTLVHALALHPQGGAVVVGQLTEPPLGPSCSINPKRLDFGLWAVDASGRDRWKVRMDLGDRLRGSSAVDIPRAVFFDSQGRMIIAGAGVYFPTDPQVIVKLKVPIGDATPPPACPTPDPSIRVNGIQDVCTGTTPGFLVSWFVEGIGSAVEMRLLRFDSGATEPVIVHTIANPKLDVFGSSFQHLDSTVIGGQVYEYQVQIFLNYQYSSVLSNKLGRTAPNCGG